MKKKTIIALAAAAAILLAALLGWYLISRYNAEHVKINGQMLPRTQTVLDLSGQAVPEPAVLQQFYGLQELNVQNTGISIREYEALKAALSGCRILWSVPFLDSYYPEDTQELTVTGEISLRELEALPYFPALKTVDARLSRDYKGIDFIRSAFPQLEVLWEVDVGSQKLTEQTTELVLGDGTLEQLSLALARIPGLLSVDARGCQDYAALTELQAQYPQCGIFWDVALGDTPLPHDTTAVGISCSQLAALEEILPWLPQLQHVRLVDDNVDLEAAYQFRAAHDNLHVYYDFTLCGVAVSADSTVVDLTGVFLESITPIEESLKYFNNLRKLILVDCGLGNDVLCPLSDRNPDVHFIWNMRINQYITVRTDITYFMPFQFGSQLTNREVQLLKYCRDLVCVDLGHIKISDVSFLAYTPHIKYLMLCDSYVKDISVISGLEELVFLELFMSQVSDYSPLLSCKNLRDLNICYAPPASTEALEQMTWLDNLWIKGYYDEAGIQRLQSSLPNTRIVLSNWEYVGSTEEGWRELQNYYDMRDYLGMPYMPG